MLLRLVPQKTEINFLGFRKIAIALSALLIVASMALFAINSLNYGIDFKGGIKLEIGTQGEPVDFDTVRSSLNGLNLGEIAVQGYGGPDKALIRVERQPGGNEEQNAAMEQVRQKLSEIIEGVEFRDQAVIGPKVSGELKQDGTIAVSVAVLLVLVYIWFRFEWQFGLGAVIALVHDVLLTIGFFAITRLEFNLSIIAALLTIVGYSLNDTVVVYDRVRENIRKYRKKPMEEVLNFSLNQTLSRTVMTSVTTLLALVALYVFGGPVIQGFTAAMIWGVVIGTYSSIFIASPVLLIFKLRPEALLRDESDDNDPTVDKSRPTPFDQM
ncbi:protein translocase subunit SecF [Kordiimonas sp. SCSIO 12610]|uniref:protein translocase subunit SecF n=1 Tax=Kordiimonas sp. SCSIO 12610 TaxID=2829597 RepID=UPI00210A99A1|nr:protein translocase subunit SecF [Kordiimonas sp. SCSIO 12610]UTW54224.1 protein translocase subunit SecF [Kordiimonas sp. SCSIO 12610]